MSKKTILGQQLTSNFFFLSLLLFQTQSDQSFKKRFCLSLINQEELIIVNVMQTLSLQVATVHTDYKNIAALVY